MGDRRLNSTYHFIKREQPGAWFCAPIDLMPHPRKAGFLVTAISRYNGALQAALIADVYFKSSQ